MIEITNDIAEAKLITHAGTFHPDDVFSTAFLHKLFPDGKVIRVKEAMEIKANQIIYDIGYGKYDHHGLNAEWRNDKIKYSSFGLLWRDFGRDYLRGISNYYEEIWQRIDTKLVCQIDGIDNGNFPIIKADYELLDLDKIIDLYNNNWDENKNNDDNFILAVNCATAIFDNLIKREISNVKAYHLVINKLDSTKGDVLYLEEYSPYEEAIFADNNSKGIKAVIYPAKRGGYNIKPITISYDSKELKYTFPKEWWGLHDDELANISGIKTARFIHLNGFLAVAGTKEDAYLLCEKLS